MADDVKQANRDEVSTEKKIDDLYDLIDGIEVAMMTTPAPTGGSSRGRCRRRRSRARRPLFVTNVADHRSTSSRTIRRSTSRTTGPHARGGVGDGRAIISQDAR